MMTSDPVQTPDGPIRALSGPPITRTSTGTTPLAWNAGLGRGTGVVEGEAEGRAVVDAVGGDVVGDGSHAVRSTTTATAIDPIR